MGNKINIAGTGLVYRNPKPHLRSVVAYHPSLTVLSDNEFLATFDLGQAVESLDYHTCIARSNTSGESWEVKGPLLPEPARPLITHSVRTSRLADGSLVGFGGLYHRRGEDEDLVNRDTFGLVPVELFTIRSFDKGLSWTAPRVIETPLIGPSWEICHPIVELRDGRWLAPTSTWRDWDAKNYEGDRAVVLISDDRGESWLSYGCSFDGRETKLSYLEQSVIQLQDGSILAVSWVFAAETGSTRPTVYSISEDRGKSFSDPEPAGFVAQTCKVIQLSDGRLLCVYRRNDRPGLWANLARLDGERWVNLSEAPLWEGAESGMSGRASGAEELSSLKFGHPSLRQISKDQVLVLFWCQENCLTNIRWIKLRLS
jgi:sialidase-1